MDVSTIKENNSKKQTKTVYIYTAEAEIMLMCYNIDEKNNQFLAGATVRVGFA